MRNDCFRPRASATGAGIAATVLSGSQPAGADGTAVLIGETNTATNPTNVTASAGDGIQGFTSSSENSGLYGNDTSPGGGNGVYATSTNGTGVVGNFRRR